MQRTSECWAILRESQNALDGTTCYLMGEPNGTTRTFLLPTRAAARSFISDHYGYIAKRPDLKREPHGWKMPRPVRVRVTVQAI